MAIGTIKQLTKNKKSVKILHNNEPDEIMDTSTRRHCRKSFNRIVKEVTTYAKNPNKALLDNAYRFAFDAHKHQVRKSGVPYIEHCLETGKILTKLRMDVSTVAAGLIHDVVEDTGITIDDVIDKFGEEIGLLVDGTTKISELTYKSTIEKQAENYRKMILSMAQDIRVIIIKLADRLHNMRTLEYLPPEKAKSIALETKEVYAPLAHRFGIATLKWELEDLSLKILDPPAYRMLVQKVTDCREEREKYIRKVTIPLKQKLEEVGIKGEVTGRAKSIYSIYRKMKGRNKPFEEIFDLFAIRIIVNKVDECYFALGIIHTLFTPVHDQFTDYIATPKLNMYQSLHTTVVGPEGKMIEIQIRTNYMHRVAEIGIAAHWKYKEGRISENDLDRYSTWLREIVDWQKDTLEPEEYMDILKTNLFISEVFVFTPKGDLLKLPIGSTPVDFAFAVHTDIGMNCIGAKVNGRIVPLNTKLKSGDSIEIITSINQHPHQDWIKFAKTSKAKNKINKWLKETQFQEAMKLGEEILKKGLRQYKIEASKERLKKVAKEIGKPSLQTLYAELGHGDASLQKVIECLDPEKLLHSRNGKKQNIFKRFVSKASGSNRGIRVQGVDNLLIGFAQCCHPIPGDSIVGFITKGRGIVIHRRDCTNALNLMEIQDRNIEVEWDVDENSSFMVQLRILAEDRNDFLKDVSESFSSMDTNITKVNMNTENSVIITYIVVDVKNLSHLTRVIRKIFHLKGIISVERVTEFENVAETSL